MIKKRRQAEILNILSTKTKFVMTIQTEIEEGICNDILISTLYSIIHHKAFDYCSQQFISKTDHCYY